MLNAGAVSIGDAPLIAGMTYIFKWPAKRNGEPFDLTGCTVSLMITDPSLVQVLHSTTIAGMLATTDGFSLTYAAGLWTYCWKVVLSGSTWYTPAKAFRLVAAGGIPSP